MARKTIQLATGNIYHVISRGNAQQNIFFSSKDNFRLIRDLHEFNDVEAIDDRYRQMLLQSKLTGSDPVSLDLGKRGRKDRKRKLLVEILAFCLMPNHFHLLLRQVKDGGISLFMQKVKGGYAAYINKKYDRTGSLFQSHFKAVDIENDYQLNTIFSYIHTNPCQLTEPLWKTAGLRDEKKALATLNSYRWSSYLDYIGKKNFPSLTNRVMFTDLYGGPKGCAGAVGDWIKHKADSYEEDLKYIALE
ncbi:MAG: transposase [Candidatus Spechtbacterales bacterium]